MCMAARTFFDGERKASREAYVKVCIYIVVTGNRETHTIVLLTFVIPCLLSLSRRMDRRQDTARRLIELTETYECLERKTQTRTRD